MPAMHVQHIASEGCSPPIVRRLPVVIFFVVWGSLSQRAASQDSEKSAPDWPSGVVAATRMIPLYYVRDAEKVIALVRGSATPRSRPTSSPRTEQLQTLAKDRRRLLSERAALLAQSSQPTSEVSALTEFTMAPSSSIDDALARIERELAQLNALEQVERIEAFRKESQNASTRELVIAEASESPDAADRVQIAVIGEGQLHLRGPLEGVNAIARMVHEIDQPVGQVKIGIHVLQFTGSEDVALEDSRRHFDRSLGYMRQMIQASQKLFRSALGNVAARYQASDAYRLEEAFFYEPCVRNFRMLNGAQARLSIALLDSRDIVTTLYFIGLATPEARREILLEFHRLAEAELPKLHEQYEQAIAAPQSPEARKPSFLARLSRTSAPRDPDRQRATGHLDFSFKQTMSYFGSSGDRPDAANALQIATTRFQRATLELRQGEAALAAMRNDRLLVALTPSNRPPSGSLQTVSGEQMDAASFGRLADHVIEQQAARILDLQELVRSEVATLDSQLKRLTTAFEDDLRRQFCKPILADLRHRSGARNVQMGQVQTTTIRTSDRMLARVSPSQVAVLDRPDRPVLLQEGLQVGYGLAQEAQSVSQSASLHAASGAVLPGGAHWLAKAGLTPVPGQHLGELVETAERTRVSVGDDIAVTPVIQPDGCSVAFHLIYAHAPERESDGKSPTPAGVQRHLIEADVQIPSLELQEVSRFRVALDSDKQERGIPLLEDVPGLGVLFRPRRATASTTQENIILVDAVVYPTALSMIGKTRLALDSNESRSAARPATELPFAGAEQSELTGWVLQTLRSQARASLSRAGTVQRIARPPVEPDSRFSAQPFRR